MGNGFRAAMNAGDPLGRVNYSCGGPNMLGGIGASGIANNSRMFVPSADGGQSKKSCDGSGIPAGDCDCSGNVLGIYIIKIYLKT